MNQQFSTRIQISTLIMPVLSISIGVLILFAGGILIGSLCIVLGCILIFTTIRTSMRKAQQNPLVQNNGFDDQTEEMYDMDRDVSDLFD